jgi:hypothetical protein
MNQMMVARSGIEIINQGLVYYILMGNGIFRSEVTKSIQGEFSCSVKPEALNEGISRTYRCKLTYTDGVSREILLSILKRDSRIVGRTAALDINESLSFTLNGIYQGAWTGMYASLNPSDVGVVTIRSEL